MTDSAQNLIWIDLEMTGLRPEHDRIIEIATIVTDAELQVLAEGPVMAVHQPEARLLAMDEWNTRQHNGSGLVKRVLESTPRPGLSNSCASGCPKGCHRCAAIRSARTGVFSTTTCRRWSAISTTGIWT